MVDTSSTAGSLAAGLAGREMLRAHFLGQVE